MLTFTPVREIRNALFSTSVRAFCLAALLGYVAFGSGPALGQTDSVPDRPPVAAPTSRIEVDAIPVVLSDSQEADEFASGLLQGLVADGRAQGIAAIAIKDDHVMLLEKFGAIAPDTRFAAGALSNAFYAVAVMQLVEHGRASLDEDIGKALGENRPRGITITQVLTGQAGNPSLLPRAVEKIAGTSFAAYLAKQIVQPLGLSATSFRGGEIETTLGDTGRLGMALVNRGVLPSGRILEPASVVTLETTHFAMHPALPGWAYGFAEMRRYGWRALQQDDAKAGFSARLVIVPDAKLAYVTAVRGRSDAAFWRTLDDGLFDKLLMRNSAGFSNAASSMPAPALEPASAIAGIYELSHNPVGAFSTLKTGNNRLEVRAGANGSLIFSGAENATLTLRPGLYWATADGNLNAVVHDGDLLLSTGLYRPIIWYKRPATYALLALLMAVATIGIALLRQTNPAVMFGDRIDTASHQDKNA